MSVSSGKINHVSSDITMPLRVRGITSRHLLTHLAELVLWWQKRALSVAWVHVDRLGHYACLDNGGCLKPPNDVRCDGKLKTRAALETQGLRLLPARHPYCTNVPQFVRLGTTEEEAEYLLLDGSGWKIVRS